MMLFDGRRVSCVPEAGLSRFQFLPVKRPSSVRMFSSPQDLKPQMIFWVCFFACLLVSTLFPSVLRGTHSSLWAEGNIRHDFKPTAFQYLFNTYLEKRLGMAWGKSWKVRSAEQRTSLSVAWADSVLTCKFADSLQKGQESYP